MSLFFGLVPKRVAFFDIMFRSATFSQEISLTALYYMDLLLILSGYLRSASRIYY